MAALLDPNKGTWVLLSFVAFFALIVAVNTVFISTALNTHSGVVTEKPYEKGLAFDQTLELARAQPDIQQKAEFHDGVLQWSLRDSNGQPITAEVNATLVRTVKDGYDFQVKLEHKGDGVYETPLDLPLKGRWEARLKAQWKTLQYQTRYPFVAK
jgi:nitrogen fixation protein FixH